MVDYFALLGEPRRPWLDPGSLKTKFLALSAAVHPDRTHSASDTEKLAANARFADLNTAYNCLREPRNRLQHLLELELGSRPNEVQQAPGKMMDLFLQVGQRCRDVDLFLVERDRVSSPLLKVRFFEQSQEWSQSLITLQKSLNIQYEIVTDELKRMNDAWENAPFDGSSRRATLPLERLEQVYSLCSYLARWSGHIHERIVQLSF